MELSLKIQSSSTEQLTRIIEHVSVETIVDWDFMSESIAGDPKEKCFKEFFDKHIEKINFYKVSENTSIKWNDFFISWYGRYLNFEKLAENSSIPFSFELVMRYCGSWKWGGSFKSGIYRLGGLSFNPKFPFQLKLMHYVEELVSFRDLGMNPSFIIFNPNSILNDYWPCSFEVLQENFEILMKYWSRWSFERTKWVDDNLFVSGIDNNSIYDNKSIDWEFVNNIKINYKFFFENWNKPNVIIDFDDDNDLPY